MIIEFLVEAADAVGDSKLWKVMNFSVGFLQTLVKLVHIEILELIACSATGTGMLVKTALTSNETKVSSAGSIKRCSVFFDEIYATFNKE